MSYAAHMPCTALVAGATGLVGGYVLDALLSDPHWSRVVVLTRRPTARAHPKLSECVVDFDNLPSFEPVDDVFACLGTTLKIAGSKERFRQVDHDYTVTVARLARAAGACRLALVSSIGANSGTGNFYLRVKGETERDIRELGFPSLVIAQPSLLLGRRQNSRLGELLASGVAAVVAPLMLGGLRAYRPIEAQDVASALVGALCNHEIGERTLTHEEILSYRPVRG